MSKGLVLPEAEHCSCISSLPPSAAPKHYHNDPLHKSAQEGCCPGAHRLPLPVTLFFFLSPLSHRLCVGRAFMHSWPGPRPIPSSGFVTTTALVLLGSCHGTVKGKQPSH